MEPSPHRIPHDHKYQSRGDFAPSSSKRDSVLSDDSTLVASYGAGSKGKKLLKSGSIPLKSIEEDYVLPEVKVAEWIGEQKVLRKKRRWVWLLIILIVLTVILVPVLVTRLPKQHGGAGAGGNSTLQTTTVLVPQVTTETLTPAATTVTASTTSIRPTHTSVPTPIEGFQAYSWDNGDVQLFYADNSGHIMSTQSMNSGSWSSPRVIASDAISGTTIGISVIYTESYSEWFGNAGNVFWRVIYIDKDNILQEKQNLIDLGTSGYSQAGVLNVLEGGKGWVTGHLGSYKLEVSSTLYQESCTIDYNVTESPADAYLYYDAASGGMQKLGWFYNDTWEVLYDLPPAVTSSNKAIVCTGTDDELVENLWVVDQEGYLQQWWFDAQVSSSTWNEGVSYTGPISSNTSLVGFHVSNFTEVYFQAPNSSIMQLSIQWEGASTIFSPPIDVGVGLPGTRFDIRYRFPSSTTDPAFSFSLFFQNGTDLMQQSYIMDNNTGLITATSGEAKVFSMVKLGGGISIASLASNLLLCFCFVLVMWVHL